MRKLVTFRTINEVRPHSNADKLDIAIIGGWQCIVKKGEYKSGDVIIFFEIDSLLPIKPEFEFLRQYSYIQKEWLKSETNPEGEGFRLRSIKLRGEISQGLIVSIPNDLQLRVDLSDKDGVFLWDLSDYFGVIKYDPPEKIFGCSMGGRPRGEFPYFIRKTDQERIQNINYKQFEETFKLAEKFEVTQKMDGSSLTCFYLLEDSKFADEKYNGLGICSRNVYLKTDEPEGEQNVFVEAVFNHNLRYAIEATAKELGYDIAVQGELVGEGIQDNLHDLKGHEIHVFDIFNITEQKYLLPSEREEVFKMLKDNGFDGYHVEIMELDQPISYFWIKHEFGVDLSYTGDLVKIKRLNQIQNGEVTPDSEAISNIRKLILEYVEFDLPHGKPNEGLVFKSTTRDFSFKAVSNKYLLFKG